MMTARAEGLRRGAARALACAVLLALAWTEAAAGPRNWQRGMHRWQQRPQQQRQDILRAQRRFHRLPPRQRQRLFEEYRRQHKR